MSSYSGQPPRDDDSTIVMPTPGRRRPSPLINDDTHVSNRDYSPSSTRSARQDEPVLSLLSMPGNPLLGAASTLLSIVVPLRTSPVHRNVTELQDQMATAIRQAELKLREARVPPEIASTARYILCAFIDETVMNTAWGSNSAWAGKSLLSIFHNETGGGEKFFTLLDRMEQQPRANIDLLELCFVCLCLGFRGKYGLASNGQSVLEQMRHRLYQSIADTRGDHPTALSDQWQPARDERSALQQYVPLWVVGAVTAALCAVVFTAYSVMLQGSAKSLVQQLDHIAQTSSVAPRAEASNRPNNDPGAK